MYKKIIRPLLFLFPPERTHNLSKGLLRVAGCNSVGRWMLKKIYGYSSPLLEREVFGVKFANPVGIAAGFDTDAGLYRQLSSLGFGFVEAGTITPKPQPGNLRPRLFRLPEDEAMINRVGFDNGGMEKALDNLRHRRAGDGKVVGCNISCNTLSQDENVTADYLKLFRNHYQYVDYFVVNVTGAGLDIPRLQNSASIEKILGELFDFRRGQNRYRPVLLKISPDWEMSLVDETVRILIDTPLDGLVVAGMTSHREGLATQADKLEQIGAGGLSGRPLPTKTIDLIRYTGEKMEWRYPIIASGGVMTPEDAQAVLDAGASLVEVYTGLIYNGPKFAKKICRHLDAVARERAQ